MPIPASFAREGFALKPRKYHRLMLGTDGPANSGKTEFGLTAPGPGIVICLDRGFDAMLDNPNPPKTRRNDYAFKVIEAPQALGATKDQYLEYWKSFRDDCYKAAGLPECRTVVIDGDSDSWELQRLAEFGKLTQIPSIMYTNVNAARRAMYARAYDAGKIVIATNKINRQYKTVFNPDGTPKLSDQGKEIREWDGKTYDRQGFNDQDYLWAIQLRHLFRETTKGPEWGIKITKCKADVEVVGMELWGSDCNFQSLVEVVYPHIPLSDWGY